LREASLAFALARSSDIVGSDMSDASEESEFKSIEYPIGILDGSSSPLANASLNVAAVPAFRVVCCFSAILDFFLFPD
jgi:hypothetical protein